MLAAIATIASMALPPCSRMSRPASAASVCGAATAAWAKMASSDMRVPLPGSPCYRPRLEFAKGSARGRQPPRQLDQRRHAGERRGARRHRARRRGRRGRLGDRRPVPARRTRHPCAGGGAGAVGADGCCSTSCARRWRTSRSAVEPPRAALYRRADLRCDRLSAARIRSPFRAPARSKRCAGRSAGSTTAYVPSPVATRADLARYHDPDYVEALARADREQSVDEAMRRRFHLGVSLEPDVSRHVRARLDRGRRLAAGGALGVGRAHRVSPAGRHASWRAGAGERLLLLQRSRVRDPGVSGARRGARRLCRFRRPSRRRRRGRLRRRAPRDDDLGPRVDRWPRTGRLARPARRRRPQHAGPARAQRRRVRRAGRRGRAAAAAALRARGAGRADRRRRARRRSAGEARALQRRAVAGGRGGGGDDARRSSCSAAAATIRGTWCAAGRACGRGSRVLRSPIRCRRPRAGGARGVCGARGCARSIRLG